ncbi:hypothetical protein Tco_0865024 [Tanacetum coccineum]
MMTMVAADHLTKALDVSSLVLESLGRALDGTEALMLPKLFILWLATVSTDSAELVPMGKVRTAIETLKKNTAKRIKAISLSPYTLPLQIMAVLESCPKHNMVHILEKTDGNAKFHEIIDFLMRTQFIMLLTTVRITPLFASMLVQPTEDEGAPSERPSEAQPTPYPPHPSEATIDPQSDPSPRPSPSTTILDSLLGSSGGNHGGKRSLKKNWMQKEYVSKQGRKSAKAEPSVHKDPLFDEMPEDTLDYMETEDAQDVGRTRDVVDEEKENAEDVLSTAQQKVSTDKEKVSTDRPIVSTDGSKVSTDKEKDSTDRTDEGTDDQTEGGRATQTTQTPTSTIFGDDETIAQVLLNMSQAKAVSREKEKGVEFKDIEETERPRPTSTRSLLTLKPLPKIDPKDKGKKKIEEEDESESESDGIPEAEKKFKQLASDEEMARKVQEEWEGEEERKRLAEEEATNDAPQ